jgi:hypothetical protein
MSYNFSHQEPFSCIDLTHFPHEKWSYTSQKRKTKVFQIWYSPVHIGPFEECWAVSQCLWEIFGARKYVKSIQAKVPKQCCLPHFGQSELDWLSRYNILFLVIWYILRNVCSSRKLSLDKSYGKKVARNFQNGDVGLGSITWSSGFPCYWAYCTYIHQSPVDYSWDNLHEGLAGAPHLRREQCSYTVEKFNPPWGLQRFWFSQHLQELFATWQSNIMGLVCGFHGCACDIWLIGGFTLRLFLYWCWSQSLFTDGLICSDLGGKNLKSFAEVR